MISKLQCSVCGFNDHRLCGKSVKRFCTMYCLGCHADQRFIPRKGVKA